MSVIAGCPQGESWPYSGNISTQGTLALVPGVKGHLPWSRGCPLNRDSTVLVLIVYHTGQAQMDQLQTVFCFTRLPIWLNCPTLSWPSTHLLLEYSAYSFPRLTRNQQQRHYQVSHLLLYWSWITTMKKKTPRNRKKCDVTLLWQQNFWITTIGSLLKVTKTARRRRQRERQKSNRFGLAKQQLCTCITLFCTFLSRRCTTATWNFPFYGMGEHSTNIFFFFFLR